MYFGNLSRHAVCVAAALVLAGALSGCSSLPDWMGGDSDDTTAASDTTTPPADQSAASATATAPAAASTTPYPDLADTPDRPAAPSTPDEQKQVADSLGAAGTAQNYSADQLRAGTEAAAAPPPAEAPHEDVAEVDPNAGHGASSASGSDTSADSDGASAASTAPASGADTSAPAAGADAAAPAPAPTTAVGSSPTPAMSGPPSGPPAVPASTVIGAQAPEMTDAQLGFQPSKAPPLDASVAQFVPQPIMDRYRQTAAIGGAPGVGGGPAVPSVPASQSYRGPAIGGPEMSGAVVANFDSLQGGSVAPSVYANASGLPPTVTVIFPNDTTILSASAKEQVRAAAQEFNANGATGYIRVVGHSSSRDANMSPARRLQWDFEHSQARANSVARALIAAGVPADKVLVNAVGDDNQSDAESSRRADIFIQS